MKYLITSKAGSPPATHEVEADNEAEAMSKFQALLDEGHAPTGFSEDDGYTCSRMADRDKPETPTKAGEGNGGDKAPTVGDTQVLGDGTHFGGYASGSGPQAHRLAGPSGLFERNMRPTHQGQVDATTGMGPAKMRPGDLARAPAGINMPFSGAPAAHRSQAVPEPGRYIGDGADPITLNQRAGTGYHDPRQQEGSVQYGPADHNHGPVVTRQMIDDGSAPPAHPSIAEGESEQSPGASDPSPAQNGNGRKRRAPVATAA